MPTTPGLTKLPGVLEEKDGVMQSVNGFLTAEQLDQPSVGQTFSPLAQSGSQLDKVPRRPLLVSTAH
jgi:hypothetical protein